MARSGGTWGKGQGGKPKGAKDHFPRSAKRIVEGLLEDYGCDLTLLDRAMRRGLEAKPGTSAPYCTMVIEHLKGAPDQAISLKDKVVLAPRD